MSKAIPQDQESLRLAILKYGIEWKDDAACRDKDSELWFPDMADPKWELKASQAIAICERCPVKQTCLDYAIEAKELHGIWGGVTARQRGILIRKRNAELRNIN